MKDVEATGRTLEEALQIAARQLGVGVDAVDYEIVEEGTKGFLGLGQTPTVLRAWVNEERRPKPPAPPEPEETEEIEEIEEPEEIEDIEELPEEPAEEEAEEQEPEVEIEVEIGEPAKPAIEPEPEVEEAAVPTESHAESIRTAANLGMKMLTDVTKAMDVDATPELRSTDADEIQIELVGKDVALLIGKRGQTLDALQYLTSIVANRGLGQRYRVVLDAEGYRERHRQMLEQKAIEYARAVAAEGREAVLEPQSARDRRIVHMALAEHPDVYTYSEGEGEDRHVVISPKK